MEYPKCKTCRWWKGRDAHTNKQHKCSHQKLATLLSEPLDGADGRGNCIYTGPDFGCIHHEPKE